MAPQLKRIPLGGDPEQSNREMHTGADRDLEELRAQYAHWPTEDLLRVVNAPQDYRQAAVQAAQEILAQREPGELAGLTTTVIGDLKEEQATKQRVAQESLGPTGKVLCFLFCGIPGIAFAAVQEAKGKSRRSHEAWICIGYGWMARAGLVLLGFMLSRL